MSFAPCAALNCQCPNFNPNKWRKNQCQCQHNKTMHNEQGMGPAGPPSFIARKPLPDAKSQPPPSKPSQNNNTNNNSHNTRFRNNSKNLPTANTLPVAQTVHRVSTPSFNRKPLPATPTKTRPTRPPARSTLPPVQTSREGSTNNPQRFQRSGTVGSHGRNVSKNPPQRSLPKAATITTPKVAMFTATLQNNNPSPVASVSSTMTAPPIMTSSPSHQSYAEAAKRNITPMAPIQGLRELEPTPNDTIEPRTLHGLTPAQSESSDVAALNRMESLDSNATRVQLSPSNSNSNSKSAVAAGNKPKPQFRDLRSAIGELRSYVSECTDELAGFDSSQSELKEKRDEYMAKIENDFNDLSELIASKKRTLKEVIERKYIKKSAQLDEQMFCMDNAKRNLEDLLEESQMNGSDPNVATDKIATAIASIPEFKDIPPLPAPNVDITHLKTFISMIGTKQRASVVQSALVTMANSLAGGGGLTGNKRNAHYRGRSSTYSGPLAKSLPPVTRGTDHQAMAYNNYTTQRRPIGGGQRRTFNQPSKPLPKSPNNSNPRQRQGSHTRKMSLQDNLPPPVPPKPSNLGLNNRYSHNTASRNQQQTTATRGHKFSKSAVPKSQMADDDLSQVIDGLFRQHGGKIKKAPPLPRKPQNLVKPMTKKEMDKLGLQYEDGEMGFDYEEGSSRNVFKSSVITSPKNSIIHTNSKAPPLALGQPIAKPNNAQHRSAQSRQMWEDSDSSESDHF